MLNEKVEILEYTSDVDDAFGIRTVPDILLRFMQKFRKPDAFKVKRNGEWIDVSTDEFALRVEDLFFALRALGVKAGDRVAIMSENRLEWAIADYAVVCGGAITVPIYPTLSSTQIESLLRDCEPHLAFVSSESCLAKLAPAAQAAAVRYVVAFDEGAFLPGVVRLEMLYAMGRQLACCHPGHFQQGSRAIEPESVATIIYTSGTTGVPKGAMLTHRNLAANVVATSKVLPLTPEDLELSFLPLSHIFQRHVDYAALYAGSSIAYAESLSLVAQNIVEVKPTFAAGVPRFFEKVYARIMAEVGKAPRLRRAVFEKAVRAGRAYIRTGRASLRYRAAERVVFRKIRERLGGRLRWFISGGAALEREIAEFFYAAGMPILEGYGLTETSPVITLSSPFAPRIGSVGRPVGDVEVQIAPDGEILVRGSSVMTGYYRLPGETEEALRDGWFHTGDIGEVDEDGYLRVTDRKKDLIVTSTGKNVAPQAIENRLKLIPYFENVVVIGDGRNFVSALVVPDYAALEMYARSKGIPFESRSELISHPSIYALCMDAVARLSSDFAGYERVRKIAFIESEFTIDGGELTPTMKVRRNIIEKKYKAEIDRLYAA
jgi:long-chain acyl-CoA synthetase